MSVKHPGFTIVELLIVLVVIGILASISVIAYSGVRERASDAAIAAKVKSVADLFEAYGAANGGNVPYASWVCVGEAEDYPAENGYDAGWCHKPSSGAGHPISASINDKLKTLTNRVPDGSMPEIKEGSYSFRGIFYDSAAISNSGKPVLQYMVKGQRTTCPYGKVIYALSTHTECEYHFTTVVGE